MKKFNLIKNRLTAGQKITLVYQGGFGGLTAFQTTYLYSKPAPHYEDSPESMTGAAIFHKPKGKRSVLKTTLSYMTPLIVYDGWLNIDTDKFMYEQINETTRRSKYTMLDHRYFTDLLQALPDGVIFADIE